MKHVNFRTLLAWIVLLASLLVGCSSNEGEPTSIPESNPTLTPEGNQISIPEENLPDPYIYELDENPYIFELDERAFAVAIANDKKNIATVDYDFNVSLWDNENKTLLKKWQVSNPSGDIVLMVFSPDDSKITFCGWESVQVWDIENETLVLEIPYKCRDGVQYSPDGKMLVAGSPADVIKAWDSASGEELFSIPWTVKGLDLSHDGSMMAYGETSKTIHLWDMEAGEDILTFKPTLDYRELAFSPDGKTLAVNHIDTITFYDVENGEVLFEISPETEGYGITDIEYDTSGYYLFVVHIDDKVEVWDLEKRELFSSFVSEFPINFTNANLVQDGSALLVPANTQTGFAYLWEFDQ